MNQNHLQKETDLIELAKNTEICKKCKNLVIGKGNEKAEIMFVGEAPGANEDEQGIPFVGSAGKNLDKLLEKVGLTLNDIYVTNILRLSLKLFYNISIFNFNYFLFLFMNFDFELFQ